MSFIGDVTKVLGDAAGLASPLGTIAGGVSALGSLFGSSASDDAMALADKQHQWDVEENQRNRDFQRDEWTRQFDLINAYNDPAKAKERMQKAGLNGTALLNGSGSSIGQSSGSPSAPSGAHGLNPMPDVVSQVGFQSQESLMRRLSLLGDLGKSSALLPETKAKLSAEVEQVLADARYTDIRTDAEKFMLGLEKLFKPSERWFGLQQQLSDIAKAYAEMKLAIKNGELIDEEKLNKAVERLLLHAKKNLTNAEYERLQAELRWIEVEKKQAIKESKSREVSNYASAEESRTQSDINREDRRIKSALADIEENAKDDKIRSLIKKYRSDGHISDADAKEAELRLSRIMQISDKRSGDFFRELDGFTEWLKSKAKIFHK